MKTMIPIFLMIFVVVLSLCLLIGISLGVGWILTVILPFSFFEATLLSMIAIIAVFALWEKIVRKPPAYRFDEEEFETEPDEIPQSRFWERTKDRTWENWYRYVFANSIYDFFLDSWPWEEEISEEYVKNLSVQLAEAGIEAFKSKSPYAKQVRVSSGKLKQELSKLEYRIYDEDVINSAAEAINEELMYCGSALRTVIRKRLWDEQANIFD